MRNGFLSLVVRHAPTIAFVASVTALVVVTSMLTSQAGQRSIATVTEQEPDVQVLETSWKDADGVTHTVKTPRQADETLDAWTARHQAAVDALQAIYPPAG